MIVALVLFLVALAIDLSSPDSTVGSLFRTVFPDRAPVERIRDDVMEDVRDSR